MYCTVVDPRENDEPGSKLLTRLTTPESSEAVGTDQETGTVNAPDGRIAVWVPGHPEITGGVVSTVRNAQEINFRLC